MSEPRTYREWVWAYRKTFGCKNMNQVCWCQICCDVERAWKDAMAIAGAELERLRHSR